MQTPQGLSLASNLDSDSFSFTFTHGKRYSNGDFFDVSVDNVSAGKNSLAVFTLNGASTTLQVRGTNDETELYDSPVNTDVTMIAHSADAATAIKRGDDVESHEPSQRWKNWVKPIRMQQQEQPF